MLIDIISIKSILPPNIQNSKFNFTIVWVIFLLVCTYVLYIINFKYFIEYMK